MGNTHPAPAGLLLAFAGLASALAAIAWPWLALPAGLAAWGAAGLIWRRATRASIVQASVLFLIGVAGGIWGIRHGVTPDIHRALTANMPLIGLLIGVSFLQLVAVPAGEDRRDPPRGPGAFRSTGLGVHLFGAVINISALFLVAERLRRHGPLGREQTILLTRFFAAGCFWSPFFGSMGAALAFAPHASLLHLVLIGVPLAAIAMLITWIGTGRHVDQSFIGYPPRYRYLRLPAMLAALVIGIHLWNSALPILAVITLLAPAVTFLALLPQRRQGIPVLAAHVRNNLPRMANELLLFLAAGVLAAGLAAILATLGGWTLFAQFGALEAWLTTVTITAFAIIGVHPVIGVATFGTMLAPLEPHHGLLAMSFLAAWTLGNTAGPLSGMNLALQGRYGLNGLHTLRWNAGYTGLMLLLTAPALWLAARLLNV